MATKAARPAAERHDDVHVAAAPAPVAGVVERPRLFELLNRGALGPVTLLCAPAGSGKTTLLSSWLRRAELPGPVAWVSVDRGESDATRFWGAVIGALQQSGALPPESSLTTVVPAPLSGDDELLDRLLAALTQLPRPVVLVIDDVHELRAPDALQGLERILARAPAALRAVLISRREPKLGLHRLRLSGALTEIRAADLEFTPGEAGELLAGSGVAVAADDLARLHQRTEGWAAGLRLAAMSLARHDAPGRFVAEFAGSERTVADYLLGEVLATLPPEVRSLLLRTCILERVNGALADLLTGRRDGARLLHELEESNSLVVAVDVGRSWFRYHHLLADLLRLELSRGAPDTVPKLHRIAAGWFAEHGHAVEAIRHAEHAGDWELAVELLARHWVHLVLDGEESTLGSLMQALPRDVVESDAEAAAITAAGRLVQSRWSEADALLTAAERAIPSLAERRRERAETTLATVQLFRARRLGDVASVIDEASARLHPDSGADPELAALALMNLGIGETWALRLADAEQHLSMGLALAERIGRPFVEVGCLGALGMVANMTQRLDLAEEHLRGAIAIAERVGWATQNMVGAVYMNLASVVLDRGRLTEAEDLIERSTAILAGTPELPARVGLHHTEGLLRMAQGRWADGLAAFRESQRLAGELRTPHFVAHIAHQWELKARLCQGDVAGARAALPPDGPGAGWCNVAARVHLAEDDPAAAVAAVAPVLSGEAFSLHVNMEIEALLLDALARSALDERDAAERSVERALALAEPQGRFMIFLNVPGARALLEAHPAHRTSHAAHLRALLDDLAGVEPAAAAPEALAETLSERELAVLRFLPTNLSASEIGSELFLSVHTVKTHMRKAYAKLDVHTRAEAVQRGRALGLLAPARRAG